LTPTGELNLHNSSVITGPRNDALLEAVESENIDLVDPQISAGADVNKGNTKLETPLIKAVKKRNGPIVLRLLAAGANTNDKSMGEKSAIYYASQSNDIDMVQALLKAGASVENAQLSYADLELLNVLLDAVADPNRFAGWAGTTLCYACFKEDDEECKQIVSRLLKAGANVNICRDGRDSPLHFAAGQGKVNIIRRLIEAGASTDASGDRDLTSLHRTIRGDVLGPTDAFRELVRLGATSGCADKQRI
jgi:uncharacterized protein